MTSAMDENSRTARSSSPRRTHIRSVDVQIIIYTTCSVFGMISLICSVEPLTSSGGVQTPRGINFEIILRRVSHLNSVMWNVLCLVTVTMTAAGTSQQWAPGFSTFKAGPIVPGALSPAAYADYVNWWQNIVGILGNNHHHNSNNEESPAMEPIDKSTCLPCTCGALGKKNRIIGGTPTYVNQYPWMAMLTYKGKFYCGAALINNKYVMTAAHCVHGFDRKKIGVRLLEHDRSNTTEAKHIDFPVLKVIKHKGYSPTSYNNDIALLRMDTEAVELGPNTGIHPVCLPAEGKSFAGYEGIITGWGTKKQGGSSSPVLQEVYVPIMSNGECRKTEYDEKRITNNMICAGYPEGKKDSCQGDSGGPMHVNIHSAYHIVGVVSWGEGCAQANRPGVYSRVNRYLNWVANNTMDACPCNTAYAPTSRYGPVVPAMSSNHRFFRV